MNLQSRHTEKDFRLYLQNELIERCKRNPKYSLRSFANAMDIEASALSKILRGKRRLTEETLIKVSKQLGLAPDEVERFKLTLKSPDKSDVVIQDFQQLSLDTFRVIADWYHYAILELTTVKGFKASPKWISKALGITVSEINIAIERLKRLGFLKLDKGRMMDISGDITTVGNDFTDGAFRKLQKQVLQKALDALEDIPYEKRDQTSLTMAINSEKLQEAREKIKQFRRSFCNFLQKDQSRDEVYQLNVSLYPLTQLNHKRRSKKK